MQAGDWQKCSKQVTSSVLTTHTRREAFEFKLPPTKSPRNADGDFVVSDSPRITTNLFSLKTIPPFSLLTTWDKQLSFLQKEEKGYYFLQHGSQCFSISDIKDMLKVHYARDLQRAVQAELNWFSEPYIKPLTVQMYPPESSIKKFQEILYLNPFDYIIPNYDMTPNEVASLCVTRWVLSDLLMWMAKTLNKEQSDFYCCVINSVNDVERLATRKLQSKHLKGFFFFVNVSKSGGKTVLGADVIRGAHWTICHVSEENKMIVYGNTLGWHLPEGLLEKVNRFTTTVFKADVASYNLVICHNPKYTMKGRHVCGNSCTPYPLQTCASVCGVISMVVLLLRYTSQIFSFK